MYLQVNRTPYCKMSSANNKYNKHNSVYSSHHNSVNMSETSNLTTKTTKQLIKNQKDHDKISKKFKILLWNCNGACKKFNAIKLLVHDERADIICLNEIKCLDQEANGELQINGYTSLFKCRTAKGGGVAMFINNKFKFEQISIPSTINEEILGVTLKFKKVKLTVFTIYNPLNKKIDQKCFEFIKSFDKFIILGDLNAKVPSLNKTPNQNGLFLDKIIQEIDGLLVNNSNFPTNNHLIDGSESSSIIDLAIISSKAFP